MARIHRRKLLQLSGAGAMAAKTGGIAAILATSRAPAYAQAATVHWLRWNDFVPASDALLKKEIAPEAEKALGIKLNIETINGKTVVLNSKDAVDSVKFMADFWKEALDEGGLAWDDTNNNRAFLSGTICATLNGASIYLLAKSKPDTYLDEKGEPMFKDMAHSPLPKGPAGQFGYHLPMTNMLMGYTKNQKAAKDFLRWITSKEVYGRWFNSQQGYSVGATTMWEEDPLWKKDPVMLPFRSAARAGRFPGYAGPADRKAAEGLSKYLITDMYAKAVQGTSAEDAVKWADAEFKSIHAA